MEKNKNQERFIIANITWNDYGWRNIYVNPHAGHAYARKYPGHESLNFEFNKQGLDTENKVFGYVQWTHAPTRLTKNAVIFFYTTNLKDHRGEIVGAYGNSEVLKTPKETKWNGFRENVLYSNIIADKELSLLFSTPLDAKKYSGNNRLVPQVGFTYIGSILAEMMISDEIEALKTSGIGKDEFEKLTRIFEFVTGKEYDEKELEYIKSDEKEQEDLVEKISSEVSLDANKRKEIIQDLNSLTPQSTEIVEYKGKMYKRDNKTIAQLKILRNFKCQICNNNILKKDGSFYIEAAHIKRKSEKGTEMPYNILILCPNHHKEFDLGDKRIIEQTDKRIVFELNGKQHDFNLTLD
jgi:putative restriction endonuclease